MSSLTLAHHSLPDKTKHDTGAGVTLGGSIKRPHHQLMSGVTTCTSLSKDRKVVTMMKEEEEDMLLTYLMSATTDELCFLIRNYSTLM